MDLKSRRLHEQKKTKKNNQLHQSQPSLDSKLGQNQESFRGTSDPAKVRQYVDCDDENGWC
ncbi:hypothetical protein ACFFGV_09750 [Pontibacillus salicampi]|uniref:DUF2553 family protein n=1 Tax=Pontibacillus salicampi TaxID=1449801 RepID=A0ABV6LN46_9BACI